MCPHVRDPTLVLSLADDIWPQYERKDEEEEPDWLVMEREHFQSQRDKNKDGRLSKEELRQWILPDDYDHAKAEAAHLIHESDVNSVSHLVPFLPFPCSSTPISLHSSPSLSLSSPLFLSP